MVRRAQHRRTSIARGTNQRGRAQGAPPPPPPVGNYVITTTGYRLITTDNARVIRHA